MRGLVLRHPKLVLLLLIEDRCENTRHQLGSSFLALLSPVTAVTLVPPLSLPVTAYVALENSSLIILFPT